MRVYLPLLLAFTLCTSVRAQTSPQLKGTTARGNDQLEGIYDIQALDALLATIPGVANPSREELVRQNIKSYMMPIRQVPVASLEWAYALTSALEFYQNLNQNFKENLSPEYLTMSLANGGTRPNLEDGLRMLKSQGTVSANIVPYGSTTIPGAVYSVEKIRIANFGYLFQEETQARNRVFEIKKALSRGNPVLVEMRTPAGFSQLRGLDYTPQGQETELHYLNITGYDLAQDTVELRGSFGRMWGNGGYIQMSFDDFTRAATKGIVLIPTL